MEAYCMKCKEKRTINNPQPTFTASGTPATMGVCPVCGTRLYRMGKTEAHAGLVPPEVKPRSRSNKAKKGNLKRKGCLVIVESPAKARTVGRYLGKGYTVCASIGHVRDLLRSKLSVDVENDFKPQYRVPNDKRKIVKAIKADAAKAKEIYLATDPDREGEAIAWHLMEAAEIEPGRARRVVFHEITRSAIEKAFENPRSIDMNLVDAQQGRRILDRLVGYNLSPLLWAKVRGHLSAGRVQSAALRIIVDREREISDFIAEEYWTIDAEFLQPENPPAFKARMIQIDGESSKPSSKAVIDELLKELGKEKFQISKVKRGSRQRKPGAPFTTSTLQQDASRRLGYTARRTMAIAQQLYEGINLGEGGPSGLITYIRTDSTQVSIQTQAAAREVIKTLFGEIYLPEKPPIYKTRARGAQEAHEAIRPTSVDRSPKDIQGFLSREQFKLYSLIWKRFVASQMKPAVYDTLTIEVEGKSTEHFTLFRVSASSIRFAGFLEVYGDKLSTNGRDSKNGRNVENGQKNGREKLEAHMAQLPDLAIGDLVILEELYPEQHFTQPPTRYTDATLIKTLEEYGIGRPSTYAPILTTIQQRGYVERQRKNLVPTEIGITVNDLIVGHFADVVDLQFTARMENEFDEIANGKRSWVEVIRAFYGPFEEELRRAVEQMPEMKAEPVKIDRNYPKCKNPLVIRHGRYGKFIGCSNFPECHYTEPLLEKIGVSCPKCGGEIIKRRTRKGRIFYGCESYPKCDFTSWKRPLVQNCPECGGIVVAENKSKVRCLNCGSNFDISEIEEKDAETA